MIAIVPAAMHCRRRLEKRGAERVSAGRDGACDAAISGRDREQADLLGAEEESGDEMLFGGGLIRRIRFELVHRRTLDEARGETGSSARQVGQVLGESRQPGGGQAHAAGERHGRRQVGGPVGTDGGFHGEDLNALPG